MSSVEQAEADLAIARLIERDPPLREAAYAPGATAEDIAAFKAHIAECAAARTAYKQKYAPPTPGAADAAATPAVVQASAGVHDPGV